MANAATVNGIGNYITYPIIKQRITLSKFAFSNFLYISIYLSMCIM